MSHRISLQIQIHFCFWIQLFAIGKAFSSLTYCPKISRMDYDIPLSIFQIIFLEITFHWKYSQSSFESHRSLQSVQVATLFFFLIVRKASIWFSLHSTDLSEIPLVPDKPQNLSPDTNPFLFLNPTFLNKKNLFFSALLS